MKQAFDHPSVSGCLGIYMSRAAILFFLSFLPSTLLATDLPNHPFITIDTEMHTAGVKSAATDKEEKLLATVSDDKTLKLWERKTGKLIRTIRSPIADGDEGQLNAVAVSPDGKVAIVGGYTGRTWDGSYSAYLYDVASGAMLSRISGFTEQINRLAYSQDGKRIAIGLGNGGGISVHSSANQVRLYEHAGFHGDVTFIGFDSQGNLLAMSNGGDIKRYGPDGTIVYELRTEKARKIFSGAVSPDEKLLAIGYIDNNTIEIRNVHDGGLAFELNDVGRNWAKGRFSAVAWSADGSRVFGAGTRWLSESVRNKLIVAWSAGSKTVDERKEVPVTANIQLLLPFKDDSILFSPVHSGFGLINAQGGVVYNKTLSRADFSKGHQVFRINRDASLVQFGYERDGQSRAAFDLRKRLIEADSPEHDDLMTPRFTANGIDVRNWDYTADPHLGSRKIKGLLPGERSSALAVKRDEKGFFFGTNLALRFYDRKGRLIWTQKVNSIIWDLAISADDRMLVAAMGDGTIRYFRADNGEETMAVYLHPDRKRWIIWLPSGFFDHGQNSEELIGFHVNRGKDKEATLVSVNQMYDLFYRPDIIDQALEGKDVSAYLKNLAKPAETTVMQSQHEAAEKAQLAKEQAEIARKVELERLALETAERERQDKLRLEQEQAQLARIKSETARKAEEERFALQKIESEQKARLKAEQELIARQKAESERLAVEQKEAERLAAQKLEEQRLAREKVDQEILASKKREAERQLLPVAGDEPDLFQEQSGQSAVVNAAATEVTNLVRTLVNSSTLPPAVRFITTSGQVEKQDVALVAELCDSGGGIGDVTLFLNDMPVAIENIGRGLKVQPRNAGKNCLSFEKMISLQQGRNVITLMAYNRNNSIESDRSRIELAFAATAAEKPQLHILTIAVNRYRDGDLRLNYAINDAEELARVVNEKAKNLFAGVHIHKIHNDDVTREKLEAVFVAIGRQTKRDDVFLLFVAGHGITGERDGAYYFLPVNFRYTGEESIAGQGVSMTDFKKYLTNIQAMKSLILIDTCNSGSFSEAIASRGVTEKTAITKLARAMGRATIAASSKNQAAMEGYEGHGVFSYTVLEGLGGKAANKKGEITVNLLANFIEETLPELTYKKWGYEQVPQKSLQGMDFPIGIR
jgi:dipeptidyl aminopeptidase/acylaminoacyl peptidase